jgi:glycine/D-amino acid oxidase-like deaminating enzyme/nitrite reductase/ring-hydroxylating ferredoxin subunit
MNHSVWLSYSDTTNFSPLEEAVTVDVAIIGGGITGITSAELLAQEGLKVAVLERTQVGVNSTGNSTGNLYAAVSEILLSVRKKFGDEIMKKIINSRKEAIGLIEKNIRKFNIDCDFKRVDWHYYTTVSKNVEKVEKALEAAQIAGVPADFSNLEELNINADILKGIKLGESAQFNPLRYVQGLAKAIASDRCLIYENTEVIDIDERKESIVLTCSTGKSITAKKIIHATHTPKGLWILHAELGPYREYGVACKIKGKHPEGAYFGYFDPSEITSTRLYERDGEQYLIVVGSPHKVGHGNNQKHIQELEKFARAHFEVEEVTHTWGAQNYKPTDDIPYIGSRVESSNIYIATGFATHGLTYGVVAAQVLCDLILGKENEYAEIYKPSRFTPMQSAAKLIKENVDVGVQYVKDYFLKHNDKAFSEVGVGEGKIIEKEGHKLAVSRDETEGLKVCSAVCTHMGCIVHWNNAEFSWDCPCHGSRFATDGEVLEGPALLALKNYTDTLRESPDHHLTPRQRQDEIRKQD